MGVVSSILYIHMWMWYPNRRVGHKALSRERALGLRLRVGYEQSNPDPCINALPLCRDCGPKSNGP